jgi:hypothetical protein
MPYELRGNCVHKVGDSKPLKCYDNHADALAYLRALEANVTDANKAFRGKLTQAETNYVPLSAVKNKACANCRWFMNDGCFIIDSYEPEPVIATGYCDRWEATPEPAPDPIDELAEALTEAIGQSGDMVASTLVSVLPTPPVADMSKSTAKTFKQRLSDLLKELRPKSAIEKAAKQSFFIFKDAAGQPHWHAIYTNNFEDREAEILTEKAHDKFIARLDMGLVPMPTLQAWHTPGSDHGVATCIWRDGHMVHAVGDFMDNDLAKAAIPYYEKQARHLKMSHMFETPSWAFDGKHYEDYNTVEITTLPPDAAANPYTSFEELLSMKERSAEKTAYLEALFGKDNLAKIDAASDDINKGLEAAKVTFKEFTDVTTPTATPAKTLDINTEKGLAEAYGDLVLQVADLTQALTAAGKAIAYKDKQHTEALATMKKTWDDETALWQQALDDVRKQVNLPVERPSQSEATVIKKGDPLKAQELQPDLNGSDPVAAWFGAKTKPMTALGGAS